MPHETIYINADIVTMNPQQPSATALLILGDRIVAVGREDQVRPRAGAAAEVVDLAGKTVLPGFIETHNHLSARALTFGMVDCSPQANPNLTDIIERIRAVAVKSEPGQWILGWGYDDTLMPESRHLHRRDLDQAAPVHPVVIYHISGHLSYANSQALKLGGVTRETPQPAGGEIHKDENGEPSGLLMEHGAQAFVAVSLPKVGPEIIQALLPLAMASYNQAGITSVHDGGIGILGYGPAAVQAYRSLELEGRLNLRVYLTTIHDLYDRFLELGFARGFGSDFIKIGAVKLFQDGSIQGLTAALTQDYSCRPGYKGWTIMPQSALDELVLKYHGLGLQIAIHANGDAAIESVLVAMERAQKARPQPELRHMIIHCQMASDDQLRRMQHLKITPSFMVNHVFYWGDRHVNMFLGPERAARIDPLASAIREGVRFTLHSDNPVTPVAPLPSIHNAVNRLTRNGQVLGEDQRISPMDAIKTYTVDAAYCSCEEEVKGSIAPGKLADFVVLSQNPLQADLTTIKNIEVLETVVGGRTVFSSATS